MWSSFSNCIDRFLGTWSEAFVVVEGMQGRKTPSPSDAWVAPSLDDPSASQPHINLQEIADRVCQDAMSIPVAGPSGCHQIINIPQEPAQPFTRTGTMRFSIILALAAGSLAAANSLPQPEPNNLVERKEAICRMKDPDDALGDPWRTGRCKATKSACGDTGGEAFRYVCLASSRLCLVGNFS